MTFVKFITGTILFYSLACLNLLVIYLRKIIKHSVTLFEYGSFFYVSLSNLKAINHMEMYYIRMNAIHHCWMKTSIQIGQLTLVIWKGYTNLKRISRHITFRIMPNHSKLMWSDVHGIISILCWQWGCRRRREDWHELNICIHESMFNRPSFSHDTNFSENVQYDQILILNRTLLCKFSQALFL